MAGDENQLADRAAAGRADGDGLVGELLDDLKAAAVLRCALVLVEGHGVRPMLLQKGSGILRTEERFALERVAKPAEPQDVVVEGLERRTAGPGAALHVLSELHQHQLAKGIRPIAWVERAALGFPAGTRLPRGTPPRGRTEPPAPRSSPRCAGESRRRDGPAAPESRPIDPISSPVHRDRSRPRPPGARRSGPSPRSPTVGIVMRLLRSFEGICRRCWKWR